MSRKYFGTDGVRGRVGAGQINPEFIMKLGWAVGKVFAAEGRSKVIIGKDTRISGYMFEAALEAGLVAAGVDVRMLGPMPTPAIAYLTRTFHAQAGIVISASHNDYHDNGIKFFSADGTKLADDIELEIEAQVDQKMTVVESADLGKVKRVEDARGRYIEFCKSTIPSRFSLKGVKIVLDCAHGATYQVAPKVFREIGAEVITIGCSPDGLNINKGVGSTKPAALQEAVKEHRADLGIAFDGDGDRLLFVNRAGDAIDGDQLLYIIAKDQHRKGGCNGVAGTLMSNLGFELALKDLSIPFGRAKVGDRYVNEMMKANGWLLGGENSGHIVCHDVTTTGDGIVAALKVLFAIYDTNSDLDEQLKELSMFPQEMINVKGDKDKVAGNAVIEKAVKQVEDKLAGRGRVLLRPSGTEPVVRVMIEGEDQSLVNELVADLAETVSTAIN